MYAFLKLKYWYKPQFYLLIVIFAVMSFSNPVEVIEVNHSDLLVHFLAYAILMNSALLAFGIHSGKINLFIYLFAYSFAIEFIQYFIPYRHFSVLDLIANALGLFVGHILGLTIIRLIERTRIRIEGHGNEHRNRN